MKKAKIVIYSIVGGGVGFGVHLVWHYSMKVELFSFGSHVIDGVVYTLAGMVLGAVLYLVISKR